MCHEDRGTAAPLGYSCTWIKENELTICAQNMADFMDGVPTTVGHMNFDFVGLQEANKVEYLQAAAKKSLSNLYIIKSKSHATNGAHPMHMASFYDSSKYNKIDSVCSQFNSKNTDRPFHILLLEDKITGDEIFFINVHAPHGSTPNTKHPSYTYSSFDAVSYDLSDAVKSIKKFDASDNYKIIMTGDFNETGWD
jgi:hypothetical protein